MKTTNGWSDLIHQLPFNVALFDLDGTCLKASEAYLSKMNIEKGDFIELAVEHLQKNGLGYLVQNLLEDGKPIGTLIIIQPTANEEVAESSHAKGYQESQARLAFLGEVAAGIAHEVNNPLTFIYAKAMMLTKQLASDTPPDVNSLSVALQKITNNAERITKIIKSLKTLARDGAVSPFTSTLVSDLVEDALTLCSERFKIHGVEVISNDIPETHRVQCRPVQIVQVLVNLLMNAYDAAAANNDPRIEIRVHDVETHTDIMILDSGSGIPVEIREKIFQPFFTTKGVGKGTGLGLSISNRMVIENNGQLILDSSTDQTCFIVRLPKS